MITFSEIMLTTTNQARKGLPLFKVVKPIEVRLNGSFLCVIEKDFLSDGASIPKYVRGKWGSWGRHSGAALLHDHLLETTYKPKWLVDVLFYIALRSSGVPALEATLFYLAVRLIRRR